MLTACTLLRVIMYKKNSAITVNMLAVYSQNALRQQVFKIFLHAVPVNT
jgi:hypothetical protein